MKKILTTIFFIMFITSIFAGTTNTKLYVGGEKYEKDGVIALTLTLAGKMIEWVYKENLGQCLKSKRIAAREIGGERVIFACKVVKGILQEDKQSKYGIRLLKIIE